MQMVLGQWSPALSFINDEGAAGAQRTAKGTALGHSQGTAATSIYAAASLTCRKKSTEIFNLRCKISHGVKPGCSLHLFGVDGSCFVFFTRSLVLKGLLLCNSPTYQLLAEFIETETDTGQISIMPKPDLRIFFRAVSLAKTIILV